MKHNHLLMLLSALILCFAVMQAHPDRYADHSTRKANVHVDGRDIPIDPAREVSWDAANVPVEPPLGTCLIDSNMIIKAASGVNICQPFQIDTTSTFSWVATQNTTCVDTDRNRSTSTGCISSVPPWPTLAKKVSGTPQNHSSGLNGALTVSGRPVSTNISNFGGFNDTSYTVVAAQELSFPSDSDPVFRTFGKASLGPMGMLGFGQVRSALVGAWDGYTKSSAVHSSPLMEAISSPGGPIPLWTLAMPRKDEKGVIVIGGYANTTTIQLMEWDLWIVSTVEYGTCEGPTANGYCLRVLGLDTLSIGNKTTPITPSDNASTSDYLLDSLSNVIRTSNTTAKAVADSFDPAGWADPASGAWFVECTAIPSQTFGVRLQGQTHQRAFLISKQDMVVDLGDNKCISAFQPPDSDGKFRLGWPFLKNVVVEFYLADSPTSLDVRQKELPEKPGFSWWIDGRLKLSFATRY